MHFKNGPEKDCMYSMVPIIVKFEALTMILRALFLHSGSLFSIKYRAMGVIQFSTSCTESTVPPSACFHVAGHYTDIRRIALAKVTSKEDPKFASASTCLFSSLGMC